MIKDIICVGRSAPFKKALQNALKIEILPYLTNSL